MSLSPIRAAAYCLLVFSSTAQASDLAREAVAFWDFRDEAMGGLVLVSGTTLGLTPALTPKWVPASPGVSGGMALEFSGSNALKTNDPSLRLEGAQTFWLRVKLGSVPDSTVALMVRSRPIDGQRGISLEATRGHVGGFVSETGETYGVHLTNPNSFLLEAGKWYDISLRFDPSRSLRVDVYDPDSGELLDSLEKTVGIPAGVSPDKNIGSGYFQLGSTNMGSTGSEYLAPAGTQIQSAGVWNRVLDDQEIKDLSKPEN